MASEEQCLTDQFDKILLDTETKLCDLSDPLIAFDECPNLHENISVISQPVADTQYNNTNIGKTAQTFPDSFGIEEKHDENPCSLIELAKQALGFQCKEKTTALVTDESILRLYEDDCVDLTDVFGGTVLFTSEKETLRKTSDSQNLEALTFDFHSGNDAADSPNLPRNSISNPSLKFSDDEINDVNPISETEKPEILSIIENDKEKEDKDVSCKQPESTCLNQNELRIFEEYSAFRYESDQNIEQFYSTSSKEEAGCEKSFFSDKEKAVGSIEVDASAENVSRLDSDKLPMLTEPRTDHSKDFRYIYIEKNYTKDFTADNPINVDKSTLVDTASDEKLLGNVSAVTTLEHITPKNDDQLIMKTVDNEGNKDINSSLVGNDISRVSNVDEGVTLSSHVHDYSKQHYCQSQDIHRDNDLKNSLISDKTSEPFIFPDDVKENFFITENISIPANDSQSVADDPLISILSKDSPVGNEGLFILNKANVALEVSDSVNDCSSVKDKNNFIPKVLHTVDEDCSVAIKTNFTDEVSHSVYSDNSITDKLSKEIEANHTVEEHPPAADEMNVAHKGTHIIDEDLFDLHKMNITQGVFHVAEDILVANKVDIMDEVIHRGDENSLVSAQLGIMHEGLFNTVDEDSSVADKINTTHKDWPLVDKISSVADKKNITYEVSHAVDEDSLILRKSKLLEFSNILDTTSSSMVNPDFQMLGELGTQNIDLCELPPEIFSCESPHSNTNTIAESEAVLSGENLNKTPSCIPLIVANEEQIPVFVKKLENKNETTVDNKKDCSNISNDVQTLLEKCYAEGDQTKEEENEKLSPDLNKLANVPVLRGPRTTVRGSRRTDCRFLFNDSIGEDNVQDIENEDKNYKSLRDSLDIVKHRQLVCSMPIKDEDESALVSDGHSEDEKLTLDIVPLNPVSTAKPVRSKKKIDMNTDHNSCSGRKVSFPEDDSGLITSYLEPVDPWFHMNNVSTNDISESYRNSCERHEARPLPVVLQQIAALPVGIGGRIECLSLRNQKLEASQVECLEEIFRRVQFKTIDFEGCGLEDDTAIPLLDMIEFYDSATQLNIASNNKIGIRGWQACARILKRTPSLRILDARETSLSEQNMPILCKALRLGTRLHTLHLENCNLTGRPLVNLAGALRLNDTISDLYLAENRLGVTDCIQLGNLVRANRTLKLLDLRNNNIQDTGCAHICKDIVEQQSSQKKRMLEEEENSSSAGLSTLVLWNNHLTVQSVPHLSSMLFSNYTLETLNLGRNNLTSEGILLLKNSLIRNRSLARLGLQATRIGNEGAVALAECIADNPIISRIDLRENSIQLAGLMALSRSLQINNSVVQLDLDPNPRAEPSPDLANQHLIVQQEIKTQCQKNQTEVHLKKNDETKKEQVDSSCSEESLSPDRKISLTCGRPKIVSSVEETKSETLVNETKRYWSPAPSPCVSPCPSPSLSPSPSPMPSPLKNRFKVVKVSEEGGGSSPPAYIANNIFGSALDSNMLSTSAPAGFFAMHHARSGSLPSLAPMKPNRFSAGKRFTVTKVTDSTASFKSSLPANRAMSSPSLIAPIEDSTIGPTIVVSSPNKAVRGFSVDDSEINITIKDEEYFEKGRSNSLELSLNRSDTNSTSDSPQSDDVFAADSSQDIEVQSFSHSLGKNNAGNGSHERKLNFVQTHTDLFLKKAPLASIEAGSFDSDSEDSEVTTQSSDSTHSDEVRISTEQFVPKPAWELQQEAKASGNVKSTILPSPNS